MALLVVLLIESGLCRFEFSTNLPISVGFKSDENDPELKKNGCDTKISVMSTDYSEYIMIGGSTADNYLITDGALFGCQLSNNMMPYIKAISENGDIRWTKVFSDNGKGTYSDVALISYPIK